MILSLDPPAAIYSAQAVESGDTTDVILVEGVRPNQDIKIDRRTYKIRRNSHSAQKSAVQLLRGVPAVNVSPDDDILLLGRPGVQIFVDGRPYAGDSTQYLRMLHGDEIDRIEVITNPSAQYSADGTGGIINFVLRTKRNEGATGTASAELSTPARTLANASAKHKRGNLTYELEAHASGGVNNRAPYHRRRTVVQASGGQTTVNTVGGSTRSRQLGGSAGFRMSYEPDTKTKLSAKLSGGHEVYTRISNAEFSGLTADFASFSEAQSVRDRVRFVGGELTLDHKGRRQGETLSASIQIYSNPQVSKSTLASFSDGSAFATRQDEDLLTLNAQADWQYPMAKGQILSLGVAWKRSDTQQRYRFIDSGLGGTLGLSTGDEYRSLSDTIAAYVTFQKAVGSWNVMPGVRLERNDRLISSPGRGVVQIERYNLFPTLHVQRQLSQTLDLTMSYSRRIDRAPAESLRPYPVVLDILTIAQGNERLRDQSTDAFEVNFHYRRKRIDASVILYDRRTRNLWSTSYVVNPAGASIYTFVNAGESLDRGGEFSLSTPVWRRIKATASVNLFAYRGPVTLTTGRTEIEAFRYSSNINLEWNMKERGKIPGDVAQIQWLYTSPTRELEVRKSAFQWLSFAYTHNFTPSVSITGTLNYQSSIRNQLLAPSVQVDSEERRPLEFRLKLLKMFGQR